MPFLAAPAGLWPIVLANGDRKSGTALSNPLSIFSPLLEHRHLVHSLVVRDLRARYAGTALGFLWAFASPLLLLAVFTFVFSEVFQAKWNIPVDDKFGFALVLFSGLMLYWCFADCLTRAAGLIGEHAVFVRKLVFPVDILAWVVVLGALIHLVISWALFMIAHLVLIGPIPVTALLLPIILLPFALFLLGMTWIVAAVGVYLRDLGQIIAVLVTLLLFASPIFYPIEILPDWFRPWMALNPIAHVVESGRGLLLWGELPAALNYAVACAICTASAWLGLLVFRKLKRSFADVL